ncbi:hypothetical protein AB0M43_38240 [Longispora sp. NPDC051575]|uniref:hypothetical protein n=1 Tax=Longispora sp. NPDC051575 TaxID=3154943 RepID=UPI00343A9210
MTTLETPAELLSRLVTETDRLVMDADHTLEIAAEQREEAREARRGRKLVACEVCDGEFYTRATRTAPYLCSTHGYAPEDLYDLDEE